MVCGIQSGEVLRIHRKSRLLLAELRFIPEHGQILILMVTISFYTFDFF